MKNINVKEYLTVSAILLVPLLYLSFTIGTGSIFRACWILVTIFVAYFLTDVVAIKVSNVLGTVLPILGILIWLINSENILGIILMIYGLSRISLLDSDL